MTQVKRVSKNEMVRMTGMDADGYTLPRKNLILVRKGLGRDYEKEVLGHEAEHMKKGEEGPFLSAAAGIVGGSLISGILGNKAAGEQADATRDAQAMAVGESRRQFDLTRQDTAPYRETGENALAAMRGMLGLPGGSDYDWQATPGYQFRVDQGQQGVQNYLGANGMRLSGRALKAIERFRQGTASDEFQNSLARLGTMAGFGQQGVGTSAQMGANTAGNVGSAAMNAGNAMANIAGNRYANMNNAFQGGLNNWMAYQQQQNMMKQLQNAAYRANPVAGDAYMPAYR